jgi:hypothetical protein
MALLFSMNLRLERTRVSLKSLIGPLLRPVGIDAAEDFFCGNDCIGDDGVVGGAGFEFELGEAACGEDGSGDEEDTFAAFVHPRKVSSSPFVR